jgi:hypothetical protein
VASDDADATRVAGPIVEGGYRGFDPAAPVVGGVGRVAQTFADLGEAGCTDVIGRHLADDHDEVLALVRTTWRGTGRSQRLNIGYGDGAPMGRRRSRAGRPDRRAPRRARYGLDTEFHGERSYWPRLALVQVAWPAGIALIDPFAVDMKPFGEILRGPGVMIAHASEQDLAILVRACGNPPSKLFDTQIASGFIGMGAPSLASLAERLLGVKLAKGDRLTDWTRRPLKAEQKV